MIACDSHAQADALEIEANAKRRLADEYDAAQERGEVVGAHDGAKKRVPSENSIAPATVSDLGLTRKQIHEARATRIKDRAIRRAGELLQQIEPATGRNNQYAQMKREGGHPFHSRQQVASDAGMSSHQAKQAVRVANIPREDFERQVESDRPPTISQLARQGIPKTTNPARLVIAMAGSAVRERS